MIGENQFCPKTGAKLSDEIYYDENGRHRITLSDEFGVAGEEEGELTTGERRSSKAALFNQFRRCHRNHDGYDPDLYRKAALALTRLKRTAAGNEAWDVHVWYALQHRLYEAGYETEWMHVHAEPRCPHCHGRLKYERGGDGTVAARCGANCTGTNEDQLPTIRGIVADLYSRAFDEPTPETTVLDFE